MTVHLLGITLYEFDVAITDLFLCAATLFFVYSMCKQKTQDIHFKNFSIYFFSLVATSSFLGAMFHLFFPQKATITSGFILWILVAGSIGLTAVILWRLVAYLIIPKYEKHITWLITFCFIYFMYYIAYVDYTFKIIIAFYVPSMVAFLIAVLYKKYISKGKQWNYFILGVLLSFIASGVQVAHINIHPMYFNYNAFYHLIQLVALYFLYLGFKISNTYNV